MALGRRPEERQEEFWIAMGDLPRSAGHPFYDRLEQLLGEGGFDEFVEDLCEPYYAEGGRPSIPPGRYFRMLFVGYFEGIDSQRGIAWRCSDSLSLRGFLGLRPTQNSPDHSSLTRIRKRLPLEVHEQVFLFVLEVAAEQGLLRGRTVAVDATTLEANAAMKSIVRKETGEDWKEYLRRLAEEAGIENPTDEQLRRFDKKRKGKKVSNKEWQSSSDPDSRIVKMKDGRTHLAYKAEHVVDLDTDLVLTAEIYPADQADSETILTSVDAAQAKIDRVDGETDIQEAVADKGYHKAETLVELSVERGIRTYIPEPDRPHRRSWKDKPEGQQAAVYANRRRVRGDRSKRLQKLRSEYVERTFAHVCETGGSRRTWLRGLEKIRKRYLVQVAARNLGLILRSLFGIGTPRGLQGAFALICSLYLAIRARVRPLDGYRSHRDARMMKSLSVIIVRQIKSRNEANLAFSTAC
jgi:transposase